MRTPVGPAPLAGRARSGPASPFRPRGPAVTAAEPAAMSHFAAHQWPSTLARFRHCGGYRPGINKPSLMI
jgi:hypothetical protein